MSSNFSKFFASVALVGGFAVAMLIATSAVAQEASPLPPPTDGGGGAIPLPPPPTEPPPPVPPPTTSGGGGGYGEFQQPYQGGGATAPAGIPQERAPQQWPTPPQPRYDQGPQQYGEQYGNMPREPQAPYKQVQPFQGEGGNAGPQIKPFPQQKGNVGGPQGQPFQGRNVGPQVRPFPGGNGGPQGQPFQGGNTGGPQGRPEFTGDRAQQPNGPQGWFGEEGQAPGENWAGDKDQSEMMDKQEKQRQGQMLSQMKRQTSGMEQGIKTMKRIIDRLKKKNIAVPAEAESLITELTDALAKIKNATELTDDIESAIEAIQDKGSNLGEWGPRLGMLEQWSKISVQIEKEMTKLDKTLAKARKQKAATQYPEILAKIEQQITGVKNQWSELKGQASAGDAEEVMSSVQDIFEAIGEANRAVGFLQQIGQVAKMIKNAEKEITAFEKQAARFEKNGKDASSLKSILAEGREKLAEMKSLSANQDAEPEEFFDLMQAMEPLRFKAQTELDKLSGKAEANALGAAVVQSLELKRLGL